MRLKVHCPGCNHDGWVDENVAGRTVHCECGAKIVVPARKQRCPQKPATTVAPAFASALPPASSGAPGGSKLNILLGVAGTLVIAVLVVVGILVQRGAGNAAQVPAEKPAVKKTADQKAADQKTPQQKAAAENLPPKDAASEDIYHVTVEACVPEPETSNPPDGKRIWDCRCRVLHPYRGLLKGDDMLEFATDREEDSPVEEAKEYIVFLYPVPKSVGASAASVHRYHLAGILPWSPALDHEIERLVTEPQRLVTEAKAAEEADNKESAERVPLMARAAAQICRVRVLSCRQLGSDTLGVEGCVFGCRVLHPYRGRLKVDDTFQLYITIRLNRRKGTLNERGRIPVVRVGDEYIVFLGPAPESEPPLGAGRPRPVHGLVDERWGILPWSPTLGDEVERLLNAAKAEPEPAGH